MISTPTTEVVRMNTLAVGDIITEVDTPEGPFYAVVKVNRCSVMVRLADDAEPGAFTMRFSFTPHDIVRKVTSA